jgi:alpha-1,3-rhamnosyltransferase
MGNYPPLHRVSTPPALAIPVEQPASYTLRVSVIVPSYNHAPFIKDCLSSVIKQTCPPLELIVIDDGSTDGSPELIEQELKECPFSCDLIVRDNKGISATLNEGLARSTGTYFAYLGSDDIWLQDFIRVRVMQLESRPDAVLAYGHSYVIDESNRIIECTQDWARYIDGNAQQMLLNQNTPFSSSVLYRRDALERHPWNETAGLEDYELYLLLSSDGNFAFDPQVLSAWRKHRSNTSRNLTFMLEECLRSQRWVLDRLGISPEELMRSQAALKWRYAGDYIKAGHKSKALRLIYHNLRAAAPSSVDVARMLLALALPRPALQWRKNLQQRRATRQYGAIQI